MASVDSLSLPKEGERSPIQPATVEPFRKQPEMRPQRKWKAATKENSDSEFEYKEEVDSSGDDDEHDAGGDEDDYESTGDEKDEDDDEEEERENDEDKNPKPTQQITSSSSPHQNSQRVKKKKSYDKTSAADLLPSHARKTKQGGYAHTNQSKGKISKANTGNTPWNKGRNRSSADRAKIAAGVRARNRAILLEKLKRLGLSEEEWMEKKREIKYLRERLRRAKLSNAKHQEAEMKLKEAEAEKRLKAAIEATTEKKV